MLDDILSMSARLPALSTISDTLSESTGTPLMQVDVIAAHEIKGMRAYRAMERLSRCKATVRSKNIHVTFLLGKVCPHHRSIIMYLNLA